MCVYCFGEIVILSFSLFPQPWHVWSAIQCAVTHRKEKEPQEFPPVFCSKDNVHSKRHLRSPLRALRCALLLCSHTFGKIVIFQRKRNRERNKERAACCLLTERYSCTLGPVLKATCSQEALYTCTDAHTVTVAHLHFFQALFTCHCVHKYELHRHLPFHLPPNLLQEQGMVTNQAKYK